MVWLGTAQMTHRHQPVAVPMTFGSFSFCLWEMLCQPTELNSAVPTAHITGWSRCCDAAQHLPSTKACCCAHDFCQKFWSCFYTQHLPEVAACCCAHGGGCLRFCVMAQFFHLHPQLMRHSMSHRQQPVAVPYQYAIFKQHSLS